ncbi:MAG: hypothetical protein LLG00_13615 [Planctomycetaceae bacterium]|nr:hypothetical protein [Planctomycetaceae bacterium]
MKSVTKRARSNGKQRSGQRKAKEAKEVRFTPDDIQRCTSLAEHLSRPENEDLLLPGINVRWMATAIGGSHDPDVGRRFSVFVDPPPDAVGFDIFDGDDKPIRIQLAEGLEEMGIYFAKVAMYCRGEAAMNRAMEKRLGAA